MCFVICMFMCDKILTIRTLFSLFYWFFFSFSRDIDSYGNIASSKAIIDQKTGECKGYGFTMFENPDDCERAIDGLNKAGLQASFARVGQVC